MSRFEKLVIFLIVVIFCFIGSHLFISLTLDEYHWLLKQGLHEDSAAMFTFVFLMIDIAGTVCVLFKERLWKN